MPLDEAYFVWLYSQVGTRETGNRAQMYWSLLRLLHKREFVWEDNVPLDENRAIDGRDLRREFLDTYRGKRITREFLDIGCSVLELLVALSRKLAFEVGDDEEGAATRYWFWTLIGNLGLLECNDEHPPAKHILDEILDKMIFRDYSPNGAGGLFPLSKFDPKVDTDQREVELWYQAQNYLLERM